MNGSKVIIKMWDKGSYSTEESARVEKAIYSYTIEEENIDSVMLGIRLALDCTGNGDNYGYSISKVIK